MTAAVTIPAPRFPAKVAAAADALARIAALPRPLVFTNGVFDVLHRGHVTCLDQARGIVEHRARGIARRRDSGSRAPHGARIVFVDAETLGGHERGDSGAQQQRKPPHTCVSGKNEGEMVKPAGIR